MSDGPMQTMTAAGQRRGRGGDELEWHRVLATDELPEGRVTTVRPQRRSSPTGWPP